MINGTGFLENMTSVQICDEECDVIHVEPGYLTCTTPEIGTYIPMKL